MTLEQKGKYAPPPIMTTFPQMVSDEIQSWDHIISATHWDLYDRKKVDGADFYVGKNELGHIHLDGFLHLATTKDLKIPLIENNLAQKFPFGGEYEGWVLYKITSESEAKQAIFLFRLNYERLMGVSLDELIFKINNYETK